MVKQRLTLGCLIFEGQGPVSPSPPSSVFLLLSLPSQSLPLTPSLSLSLPDSTRLAGRSSSCGNLPVGLIPEKMWLQAHVSACARSFLLASEDLGLISPYLVKVLMPIQQVTSRSIYPATPQTPFLLFKCSLLHWWKTCRQRCTLRNDYLSRTLRWSFIDSRFIGSMKGNDRGCWNKARQCEPQDVLTRTGIWVHCPTLVHVQVP